MSKDNKISSSSVFGQLNSFIPKDTLRKLIAETGSDRYCKKFKPGLCNRIRDEGHKGKKEACFHPDRNRDGTEA